MQTADPSADGSRFEPRPLRAVVKGDFTANTRLIWLSVLAIPIGVACAFVAIGLQRLIGLFTNIFYFQQFHIPGEASFRRPSARAGIAGDWRAHRRRPDRRTDGPIRLGQNPRPRHSRGD